MHVIFAGKSVIKNLGWYLYSGALSTLAGTNLNKQINDVIAKVAPHSLEICNAFGVPEQQISAPMYTGYQEYYKRDYTKGEHNYQAKF
jgi:acyl-CoA oxidase